MSTGISSVIFLRVHLRDTKTSLLLFINVGADLHAVALCCLLQVVAVAPKQLAEIFHGKLDWIKVSLFPLKPH